MSLSPTTLERDVEDLLTRVLQLPHGASRPLRREETVLWDSLKHVEIVFALEDAYGVQFDETEFAAMTSAQVIASMLRRHLEA